MSGGAYERPLSRYFSRSRSAKENARPPRRKRVDDNPAEADQPVTKRPKHSTRQDGSKSRPIAISSSSVIDLTIDTQVAAEATTPASRAHRQRVAELMTPPPTSLPPEKAIRARHASILELPRAPLGLLPPTPASLARSYLSSDSEVPETPTHSPQKSPLKFGQQTAALDMEFEVPETPTHSPRKPLRRPPRSESVIPTSQSHEKDFFVSLVTRKRALSNSSSNDEEVVGTSQSQEVELDHTFLKSLRQRTVVPLPNEEVLSSQSQSEHDLSWINQGWDRPEDMTIRAHEPKDVEALSQSPGIHAGSLFVDDNDVPLSSQAQSSATESEPDYSQFFAAKLEHLSSSPARSQPASSQTRSQRAGVTGTQATTQDDSDYEEYVTMRIEASKQQHTKASETLDGGNNERREVGESQALTQGSLPDFVKDFGGMFDEGSYPPDFPESLRVT